ncbi:hypothetical protein F8388_023591 [Cannabis sativa]|uniref:Protein phosphatase methylesterase 1 n=1 Tax=Cannabis sativa TaxID=3483 RepID=A0A7J6G9H0_CANSA|nr:hypothetical protein F8388_023591 [Cannabis sativa]
MGRVQCTVRPIIFKRRKRTDQLKNEMIRSSELLRIEKKEAIAIAMESSSLTSLPEETTEHQQHPQSLSAFASIPARPPTQSTPSQKYSPLDWLSYFDEEDDISIPESDDVFHVYKAGKEGPVVLCLHGGGYTGLSFSLSASLMKEKVRVVAMDLRGHGKSIAENELDLSIETMCNDVVAVVKAMYGDSPPAIVLVGHSMGGSVAVHVAASKAISTLAGLIVIDVVEGTALASLIHMQKILSSRVQHFSSIEKAIEWSVKGGSLRNIESARVSIPPTLKPFRKIPVISCSKVVAFSRHRSTRQEDVPDEFANLVLNFISRNRIGPRGVEIPGLRRPFQSQPLK